MRLAALGVAVMGVWGLCVSPSVAAEPNAGTASLSCEFGPLHRVYGGTPWLIYACDDGRSVVVVSAPGSPALPFYFFVGWDSKGLELHGEGTGNQAATDAAYADLKLLKEADVALLFKGAKALGRAPPAS